jgi:hypothetical protein
MALRGNVNTPNWLRQIAEFIPAYAPTTGWERYYIRINIVPTDEVEIWRMESAPTSAFNTGIWVTPGGALEIHSGSLAPDVIIGTSTPLTLGKWYLIDILYKYALSAPDTGRFRLFINHVIDLDITVADNTGLDSVSTHANSRLGKLTSGTDVSCSIDLDDWIGADVPNIAGIESLTSIDWWSGSHVKVVNIPAPVVTNYAGNTQVPNQHFNPGAASSASQLSSTTALATIEGVTDKLDFFEILGQNYGSVAVCVIAFQWTAAGVNGALGYGIAGAGITYFAVGEAAAFRCNNVLYRPSGLALPAAITPLSIGKRKSNDINQNIVQALTAVVEDIGMWGLEDDPLGLVDDYSNLMFDYHNVRYIHSLYALLYGPTGAACYSVGGTYVGTGTTKAVNLPAFTHFIMIRALTVGSWPVFWFASSLGGGHRDGTEIFYPDNIVNVYTDTLGQTQFVVCGTSPQVNQAGVTYEFIAFCDPGSRFNHCTAFMNVPAAASINNLLWVDDFLAEFGFIQQEVIGSTTTNVVMSFKSPGHGANDGTLMNGTAVVNWGSFAAGILRTRADVHPNIYNQSNASLWHEQDDLGQYQLQIFVYTGDGTGNRTIPFPDVTGRYPVLAIVSPISGAPTTGSYRDPSHTGFNSTRLDAAATVDTTHIRGATAPDTIDVGSDLNTNGIVYSVFIILGDSTGWNNGIFWPSPGPAEGPYTEPIYSPDTNPVVLMDGGVNLDGAESLLLVQDLSGIYTLVPNKTDDTFYDRLTGQTTIIEKIPDPTFKTGYVGG